MMRIGNGDVERIADDVDRPRCNGKIDRDMAAIDHQPLVGFDENQSLHAVGDMLLDASARRRDLIAMLVGWSEPENLLEEWLRGAPHRKLVEVVDLLVLAPCPRSRRSNCAQTRGSRYCQILDRTRARRFPIAAPRR